MRLRSALLAATILAAPAMALAQPIDGLYVGAGAGYNYLMQQNVTGFTIPTPVLNRIEPGRNTTINTTGNQHLPPSPGWLALGSVGWGFGNGLRVEGEFSYRSNRVRGLDGLVLPTSGSGTSQTYGGMVNAVYDFSLAPWGVDIFTPYFGAGIGYAAQNLNGVRFTSYPNPANYTTTLNQTHGGFAAQGIVGASFAIPPVPGLSLTAEYRVFAKIANNTYNSVLITPPATVPGLAQRTGIGIRLGDELNQAALIGFRYAFYTPPPPPPPPPPVVVPPTRSYLVFFDWDKATLTTRAREIIREAADASTKVQYTRIEVNGYTDTSGTPKYNQGLSVRRAEAVAAELVRDGVPRNAITIQGFGETHLLVPTGPGVREPQNRRVEIIIH